MRNNIVSSDGSSDENQAEEQLQSGRKRVRHELRWKRNVKKNKVIHGEAHAAESGRFIAAKTIGRPCNCKRKCFTKFDPESIKKFVDALYSLDSKDLQDAHLAGLITARKVARRRTRDGTHTAKANIYTYKVNN